MPSLGQIMAGAIAGIAGGIGNSVSNAIKNNNKNSGSSSGSSSSGSSGNRGGSSGGSSGGGSSGSGGSSGGSSGSSLAQQMGIDYGKVDLGNTFWDMVNKGVTDADYLQSIADARLDKAQTTNGLGQFANDQKQLSMQAYINQLRKGQDQLTAAQEQYQNTMQQAADQQQAAIQAGVDSAVADLNAQKDSVGKLTKANNAAAERAYMQTLNPNGSLAENLAANGLLSSGVTETSQIQAGNAYQGALNQNAQTQTEAIAEIERAITQAQLNGDLTAAQALSDMLTQIAQQGYQAAQDILANQQWQQQFGYNMGVTDAGLTGVYNGSPTLEAQRLELERQQLADQQKELDQQLALGKLTEEQYRLQNEQLQQEIQYNAWQMKQLGVS